LAAATPLIGSNVRPCHPRHTPRPIPLPTASPRATIEPDTIALTPPFLWEEKLQRFCPDVRHGKKLWQISTLAYTVVERRKRNRPLGEPRRSLPIPRKTSKQLSLTRTARSARPTSCPLATLARMRPSGVLLAYFRRSILPWWQPRTQRIGFQGNWPVELPLADRSWRR
jgi:hypothetical protein